MKCSLWKEITIAPGFLKDYEALAPFHYRQGRIVAPTRVWVAWWRDQGHGVKGRKGIRAGVLVERMPMLACRLRAEATKGRYVMGDRRAAARKINREVRCIARVVVHPRFRGMGLGAGLVKWALRRATTRYTEALAVMGSVHPFFEKAGMKGFGKEGMRYYLHDRNHERERVRGEEEI